MYLQFAEPRFPASCRQVVVETLQRPCMPAKQTGPSQRACTCVVAWPPDHNGAHSLAESTSPAQSRRAALLMAVSLVSHPTHPVQAKRKPVEYRDADTLDAATSATEFRLHVDEDQLFSLLVPAGWVPADLPDRSGVLASWYNPFEPGVDTVAVYQRAQPGATTVQQLGSPQTLGQTLANSAPGGTLLDTNEYRDEQGQVYYSCHVQFDGASAARFRSVQEFRTISCRDGFIYTLRVTTTTYRLQQFAEVRAEMQTLTRSFRLGPGL